MNPLGRRIRPPLHLESVTTTGPEVDPAELGLSPRAVHRIWTAVQACYRTGLHPGLSLVVRHRGEVVLDRAIGHRILGGAELMTTDTPVCLFSCSKAITALVIHRLAQDGVLALDDPVAQYLPAFAANGKQDVTLRALLTHRAGLARLPFRRPDPMILFDTGTMVDALCAAPLSGAQRQGYHAVTSGYILGAAAERASGHGLRELLRTTLTDPLGIPRVTYGVPEADRDRVALSYTTGPKHLPPITTLLKRLLGLPHHVIAEITNTPTAMDAIVPAAGIYAGAHDAARIFQMLVDGGVADGREVLSPATIAVATEPAGPLVIDASLPAPIRFSPGFMLGERVASLYGVNTAQAFGHLGFTSILCWADPARDISVAFLNTGKSAAPEAFVGLAAVSASISSAFPVS